MADRLARVLALLPEQEVPAYLITDLLDGAWLSGFRGSSGALLVGPGLRVLITDFRYRTQVRAEAPDWEVVEQPTGEKLHVTLAKVIKDRGLDRVGFQAGCISYGMWQKLSEELGSGELLKPCANVVGQLRQVKDEGELAQIQAAVEIADATMLRAYETIAVGMTERELRLELESYMLRQGAEKVAFDLIVCAGPNSAMCHAKPGARPLASGDLLILDLGAVVQGYHSDLTRTVAVGAASDQQREMYDVVLRAQQAGIAALAAGKGGRQVDAVAREVITAAGYGEQFGHGLGHGVGLAVHEDPRLATTSEDTLAAGNVVTVEPGVYLPELGGVRIEDLCVVTADGCRVLSAAPKPAELMVV